jgi:hypothetical protein
MNFSKREALLDEISSKIRNSQKNLSQLITKKDKNNAFIGSVKKKLHNYQKLILEEKMAQLEHLDMLYEYLERNIVKGNQRSIVFQQQKIKKKRENLKSTIKKYLQNI